MSTESVTPREDGPPADAYVWKADPEPDPHRWDELLLASDAHICQYPLWNESLRRPFLKPVYVVCAFRERIVAYACILTVNFLGLKFGLVRGGPVRLDADGPVPSEAAHSLLMWARRMGYTFVFFSHHDIGLLERLSEGQETSTIARSMWGHIGNELTIEQASEDEKTLAKFAQIARRDIRKANSFDYRITSSGEPAFFEALWPLVQGMEKRKGLRLDRSIDSYKQLLRMAKRCQAARVYKVEADGRPLEMILVIRDRDTAHYVIGALDVPGLGSMPTPSCLVHWVAMREFYHLGAGRYNLGGTTKKLDIFKQKFHPFVREFHSLVVVLRPGLFSLTHRTYDLSMRVYRFLRSPVGVLSKWARRASSAGRAARGKPGHSNAGEKEAQ